MPPARLLAALAAFALACSGSSTSSRATSEPRAPAVDSHTDAGPGSSAAEDAGSRPLTRADCKALVAHIVAVAVREDAAERPDLPPPTDEALEAMREALFEELEDGCVGHQRGVYDCAMAAQTRRELEACDAAPG